jgi:hypothetical protein
VGGVVLCTTSVLLIKHAEDEDIEDVEEEEPLNGLVEALFDEIERLRLQVRLHSLAIAPLTR